MKRKISLILVLVMAFSLCLTPVAVSADTSYDTKLVLENKNSSWNEITDDDIRGVLWFNSSGYEFEYQFFAKGLEANTSYSLIYYADPWAGDNPGAVIAVFTSNGTGKIPKWQTGSVELGMSLPDEADANYLAGAKIWLVPTGLLTDGALPMIGWAQSRILFERNLITYTDTGVAPYAEPSWMQEIRETQLQVLMPFGFATVAYNSETASELFVVGISDGEQYAITIPAGTSVIDNNGKRPASLWIVIIDDTPVIYPSVTFSQPCTLYSVAGWMVKDQMGNWSGGTLVETCTFTSG